MPIKPSQNISTRGTVKMTVRKIKLITQTNSGPNYLLEYLRN